MSVLSVTYPATPQGIDESILQPSSVFKREVTKVLLAIIFFVIVYLSLVAAAFLLAFLCGFGGLMLVVNFPRFITLMISIGLIGLGVMVIFFLFKFLFKRNKVDRSHLIEITEIDQPELFSFIRTLTQETQSSFPNKIYISPEVNASVFYDSSFWSMFFPIQKNLQIGLGLVNSVNISEFKAILAHEFGHFSQRSMKLGSYVYNVNQIIYNMLYDNDSYAKTLESWANVSGYFAFFANATVKIIMSIQWLLQKVYSVVNKNYMALSRQMEFHADSVAAYVTGSAHLITSLRRLEVSDSAYSRLFEYYELWHKKNLKPDNLYTHHLEVMNQFAREQDIPVEYGLPQVNAGSFSRYNKTRLVVKDQWASHPSTEDREAHLNALNIRTDAVKIAAWNLFRDPEGLQKQVTDKIYTEVKFENFPKILDLSSFRTLYNAEIEKYQLSKKYKGFFDFRKISTTYLKHPNDSDVRQPSTLEEILNESTLNLPYVIEGLKSDLNNLALISNGRLQIKSFEFGGKKYKKSDIPALTTRLQEELKQTEQQLMTADKTLILFFINAAEKHGQAERLRQLYSELFQVTDSGEEDLKRYVQVMQDISPIYYGELPFTDIQIIMAKVKNSEMVIKERLREMVDDHLNASYLKDEDKQTLEDYISKTHVYFKEPNFSNDALTLFNQAMNIYQAVVTERSFALKKELLEWQLSFIK